MNTFISAQANRIVIISLVMLVCAAAGFAQISVPMFPASKPKLADFDAADASSDTGKPVAPANNDAGTVAQPDTVGASASGGSGSGSGSTNITYGTLNDPRDGKTYRTVTIGTQTWMAENLNFDTLNNIGSWCYNGSADGCAKFGRLYNWSTAMGLSASYNNSSYNASAKHRGVCPSGWHVPSDTEWATLTNYVGSDAGTKLKTSAYWNTYDGVPSGTNRYGFSALPGGSRNYDYFYYDGNYGLWWVATEYSASHAYRRYMGYGTENVVRGWNDKTHGFSVRCIAD